MVYKITHRRRKTRKSSKRRKYVRRQKGGQNKEVAVFNFYNKYHYGDHILNLKFLYNISNHLKDKNIKINYYYDPTYIKNLDEVQRYVNPDIVTLLPLEEQYRPPSTEHPENRHELWMRYDIDGISYKKFDTYYSAFYNKILNILGLQNLSIDTSIYQKEDYLLDIYEKLDSKYKDVDILIINGKPNSNQFDYDKEKMDAMCIRLAGKYKVATTILVNDTIPCTMSDGLKMQDIGAISTHAKYIIAVHTGPITTCCNSYTKASVKIWFVLCNQIDFIHEQINFKQIKDSNSLEQIDSQISI